MCGVMGNRRLKSKKCLLIIVALVIADCGFTLADDNGVGRPEQEPHRTNDTDADTRSQEKYGAEAISPPTEVISTFSTTTEKVGVQSPPSSERAPQKDQVQLAYTTEASTKEIVDNPAQNSSPKPSVHHESPVQPTPKLQEQAPQGDPNFQQGPPQSDPNFQQVPPPQQEQPPQGYPPQPGHPPLQEQPNPSYPPQQGPPPQEQPPQSYPPQQGPPPQEQPPQGYPPQNEPRPPGFSISFQPMEIIQNAMNHMGNFVNHIGTSVSSVGQTFNDMLNNIFQGGGTPPQNSASPPNYSYQQRGF